MSGRNENGKRAQVASLILAGLILVGVSSTLFAQMLPPSLTGTPSASGDQLLELMLQQQRMLAEEIGVLETHMESFPPSDPESELPREVLAANLDRLLTEIVEIDEAIDARRASLVEEQASMEQANQLPDPMNPLASLANDPQLLGSYPSPELPTGLDRREERDQMLYMMQRDQLEVERSRLVDRLAQLRPDEAALAGVLQRQLAMIESDLEALAAEFESEQPDAEAIPPLDEGVPPLYPGMTPPAEVGASSPLPPIGLSGTENDIMARRRLLFEAADNLRLAGFEDLANQTIEAADGLLKREAPPLGTPEYGGPGLDPAPPEYPPNYDFPSEIPENTFGMPGDAPLSIPPGVTLPEATVTPPYIEPAPPEIAPPPVETPAPSSSDDDLRAELELLRAQLEAINNRLNQ